MDKTNFFCVECGRESRKKNSLVNLSIFTTVTFSVIFAESSRSFLQEANILKFQKKVLTDTNNIFCVEFDGDSRNN